MTGLAHHALQSAIYALLKDDVAIMATVSGVYDNPPKDTPYPYIAFGRLYDVDRSTKTSTGTQSVIDIYAYSQSSKQQVLEILDHIFDLLQSGELDLVMHHLIAMRFDYNEVTLLNDGRTYQGLIRYRAYTEMVVA